MKILVLGNDGYIGYPLTIRLLRRGHTVFGVDDFSRRQRVKEIGSNSLTPIAERSSRKYFLKTNYSDLFVDQVNIALGSDPSGYIQSVLNSFKPDTIVHLAEMPSAPWSMKNAGFASATQRENVIGTLDLLWAMKEECPNAHLVKLGTMGEYGTPECDIPEGRIPLTCISGKKITRRFIDGIGVEYSMGCPMSGLLFPRTAGSFYHLSKVMDTYNIEFCCRNWDFRSTDIMQGVVFGLMSIDEDQITRFDYDECFGTAINRFCAQAIINHPLTVYGKGNQTRGFLPLKDSLQCLTLAIENPPALGEYRTLNQFENIYSINTLADMVCKAATTAGFTPSIEHLPNPRKEAENHYYNPQHQKLFDLGYVPTENIEEEILTLIHILARYSDRVIESAITPKINWRLL